MASELHGLHLNVGIDFSQLMMIVAQSPTSEKTDTKRQRLPLISTGKKGPLSLNDPKLQPTLSHPNTSGGGAQVVMPTAAQNVSDYSIAEKILLSYTSSNDHHRPSSSLTGLPGLVKRPGDDLTEYVLSSYRQGQLIEHAVDYRSQEKKQITLPEFHPMMRYTPHAPFLAQNYTTRKTTPRHRKTLSAPGKVWVPDSSQSDRGGRLHQTAGYMRHSLSARTTDSGNKCYGSWLGISQLMQPPRKGLFGEDRRQRQVHSAIEPTTTTAVLDKERVNGNDPQQSNNFLTIGNFSKEGTANNSELAPVLTEEGDDSSKGERKTGHVLLAPHSLAAVYVHKYHPVTPETFLKGNTLPKSPRLPRGPDKSQRKSSTKKWKS